MVTPMRTDYVTDSSVQVSFHIYDCEHQLKLVLSSELHLFVIDIPFNVKVMGALVVFSSVSNCD